MKKSKLIGGFGTKGSTNQYRTQNRIYDSKASAPTLNTGFNPCFAVNGGGCSMKQEKECLRIRHITPKECFRLMGLTDEEFERIAEHQSESSLYHLAGDSIVVNVLEAIFKQLY